MKLSCIKQLVNPFLMTMMIHLSRLLGYSCWQSFLSRFMRVLEPFFQLLASALYWQSYIFGCIILTMPGVVPVVCAMFCFYLFLCLWELHMWYFYIEEIQFLLSFGLIQFIAHVARFRSFVALFAATSLWPEIFFVLVGGSFIWIQVGKWFADVRFFFFSPINFTFSLNRYQ